MIVVSSNMTCILSGKLSVKQDYSVRYFSCMSRLEVQSTPEILPLEIE